MVHSVCGDADTGSQAGNLPSLGCSPQLGLCCVCLQGQEGVKSVGSSRVKAASFQRFHKKPCVWIGEVAGPAAGKRQTQAVRGSRGREHSEYCCPLHLPAGTANRACHATMFTVNVSSSMSYRGQPSLSPSKQRPGHRSKCDQR